MLKIISFSFGHVPRYPILSSTASAIFFLYHRKNIITSHGSIGIDTTPPLVLKKLNLSRNSTYDQLIFYFLIMSGCFRAICVNFFAPNWRLSRNISSTHDALHCITLVVYWLPNMFHNYHPIILLFQTESA